MGRYVMVVQSSAKQGRDDEYNKWYDSTHARELCEIPGINSCRRLKATPVAIPTPGETYITLFELDVDDPGTVLTEMERRKAAGETTPTDSLDRDSTVLWIYEDMGAA